MDSDRSPLFSFALLVGIVSTVGFFLVIAYALAQ